eukprot:TRINITY_DN6367_c0_g1_i5.p1 TRINITY_DN6367_c0_g1~~TRINITY_DN6367_c0_g1_i5.p1  ORF type:complete len:711 (-),score=72.65 TRINITY_DN6367_c0_g1_i5:271-2403(-)
MSSLAEHNACFDTLVHSLAVSEAVTTYYDALRCTSVGASRLCISARKFDRQCSMHPICCPKVVDAPSITGLLGVIESDNGFLYISACIILLCFAVIGMVWLCWLLRSSLTYVKQMGLTRLPEAIHKALAGLRSIRSVLCQDPLQDLSAELRKRGHQLLEERRLGRYRKATAWVFLVLPAVVAWIALEKREGLSSLSVLLDCRRSWTHLDMYLNRTLFAETLLAEHPSFLESVHWQTDFVGSSTGTALLLMCCMVATLRPDWICRRMILTTHIAIYVGLAIHLNEIVDWRQFQTVQLSFLVVVRFVAAIIDGDPTNTVLLNGLATVLHVVALVCLDPWIVSAAQHIRESTMYSMMISLATVGLHWTRYDLVRQVLLVDQKSEEATAVKGMLNLMCDAVCELYHCRVAVACPKLAALTLRSSMDNLQGRAILDLVCQEDRERFSAALQNEATRWSMVHVRLLDALGGLVPAQAFVAIQRGVKGTSQHIIGFREDVEPGMLQVASAPAVASALPLPPSLLDPEGSESSGSEWKSSRRQPSLEPVPEDARVNGATAFSGRVPLVDLPQAWPELPIVWIAPMRWVIVKATRCFANAVGQSSMQSSTEFCGWMVEERQRKEWCDFAIRVAQQDGAGYSVRKLKLSPPGLEQVWLTCTMIHLFTEIDDGKGDEAMAFLVTDIRFRRSKGGAASEKRRRGRQGSCCSSSNTGRAVVPL